MKESAQRWIAWLEAAGWKVRSIALAIGVRPHTVQRWKVGSLAPSESGVASLRLLVVTAKLFPGMKGRVWLLGDDEFAAELDGAKIRALAPWDVDRSVVR